MQVTITLNNFQQTSYAKLTFNEGLSIIRGLNNNGKSSLRRAITAVIFNNPRKTKNYIKNGCTYCSVTIEVEGYKRIFWKKTLKEVIYQIGDDTPIEKAGRLCLKDVYPDHPFTLYDDSLLFNVIAQKATPIPFNQTGSQIFGIFEELYGVLSTKEDISKFTTQLSTYNNQLSVNKQQLENLHTKSVALSQYQASVDTSKLLQLKTKIQNTQQALQKFQTIRNLEKTLSSYTKIEAPITSADLKNTINCLKQIKQIKDLDSTFANKTTLIPPYDLKQFKEYQKLEALLKIDAKLKTLYTKKIEMQDKIKSLKETLPVCPTCKRPF